MKPLRFTRHARNRMRLRRIRLDEVQAVLSSPDSQVLRRGALNRWKRFRDGWLRVVTIEERNVIVVVTVIYPARAPTR